MDDMENKDTEKVTKEAIEKKDSSKLTLRMFLYFFLTLTFIICYIKIRFFSPYFSEYKDAVYNSFFYNILLSYIHYLLSFINTSFKFFIGNMFVILTAIVIACIFYKSVKQIRNFINLLFVLLFCIFIIIIISLFILSVITSISMIFISVGILFENFILLS